MNTGASWRRAVPALLLAAAVAAAPGPAARPAAAAEGAGLSDGVVRIGVLNDRSGVYADISGAGSVEAARLAVEDVGGEVLGQRIDIVFEDHRNDPDRAAAIAARWARQGVDAIADIPNSGAMLAVQEVARDNRTIVLAVGAAASSFTGRDCSPYGFHWAFDTYALAKGTATALVQEGGRTWYNLVVDYAFGHALSADTRAFVEAAGGSVIGDSLHPLGTPDLSSLLLQAQARNADVIGLLNAGADTVLAVRQAAEFGITPGRQRMAAMLIFLQNIHDLGLDAAQGLMLTTAFYWDRTEETRAWSQRFHARTGQMPSMIHAGVYSAVRHYLKAVEAAGGDDPDAVQAAMRALPVNDVFATDGEVRADGRMVHDMYLMQAKSPAESTGEWDLLRLVRVIPGREAFRPLRESDCPLVPPELRDQGRKAP
ncbi:ABC transporter substrate-binding protein [Caenispirillum bisanense]|uniref:ABC transporter substrate-binding protein n=1 Tax=Caenispirillum bisanense TaxID=414052 RepID=UPI0031DA3FA9